MPRLGADSFHDRAAQSLVQTGVAHVGGEKGLRDLGYVRLDQLADARERLERNVAVEQPLGLALRWIEIEIPVGRRD